MLSAITREKQMKKMEPVLEDRTHRETEPRLERFVGTDHLNGMNGWIPAFAGMTEDESHSISIKAELTEGTAIFHKKPSREEI
jgi:hypothetical protein